MSIAGKDFAWTAPGGVITSSTILPDVPASPIRLWLDDVRTPPDGWFWVRWPMDAILLMRVRRVDEISLDHDLGDESAEHPRTGYDVLVWIEKAVATSPYVPPAKISIHSANVVGRERMQKAIESIERLRRERPDVRKG